MYIFICMNINIHLFWQLFYLILFVFLLPISSWQRWTLIYLMDLEMGRTVCKKHDEDIDNCPLQEGTEEKMVWE